MQKKLQIASLSFRSIRFLTPKPNHLSFEVCDSVGPSNVKWRGLSYAAASSVPSEAPEPDSQKARKRVSKKERRAIVESFVNKHRSENAGKFPTITDIQKQVGGGFYFIRDIIKELEYKSKMKTSNIKDEILVEKPIDKSKRETTESVIVSSGNIETSKDKPFQDHSLPVLIDDKETVSTGYEHLEESLSAPSSENTSKTQGHESEFVDTKSHKKLEEKCINEEGYERREKPALEILSGETSHSCSQVPNDMNSVEAVSSSRSEAVGQERHLLKEEIDQDFAPSVGKSGNSHSEGHSYQAVDIENHPTIEKKSFEKAGLERKEQDVLKDLPDVDSQKNKMELSHGSLELDESKMDSSDNREPTRSVDSEKSTLWGNLKSFADGIINIWRKL